MWQISRRQVIVISFPNIKKNDITGIISGWVPTFVFFPRKTISNKWVWLKKVYSRRAMVYTGFIDEPMTQYGDIFDIIGES